MEQKINESQNLMIQVILANTSSAMGISKTICDHSNDKILKADEIICGLVYRLMIPMTDEEIEESMHNAEDIMYQESSSDEEDNEEDNENIINDLEEFKISKKVRTNTCNCDICSQVRVCLLNFNDYIPKDELGDMFKNSILKTCSEYKRTI